MTKYEPREHVIDAELANGDRDAWRQALGFPTELTVNPGAGAEPATSVRPASGSDQVGRTGGSNPPTGATAPVKRYWMGEDIDTLPRETLIEIIDYLDKQAASTRETVTSILRVNEAARIARARRS